LALEDKISVVVCTYNQEQTIGRALDSILCQRCEWPIEILIGEDASTDNTGAICHDYATRYPDIVRLFSRPQNWGLVRNYYDCLHEARGKYIADLAGDDEWCDPQKLSKELHLHETHPEVVLVHTDYRLRYAESGRLDLAPFYPYPKGITEGKNLTTYILTQMERPVVHLCTAMYRTEVYRACYEAYPPLFDHKKYRCEDLQLCALLSQRGSFAYIDSVTLNYSIAPSISNTYDDAKQFAFVKQATQLSYDLQQALQLPNDSTLRHYFSLRIHALMMHAFRAHRPELRQEVLTCAEQWGAKLFFKTKIISWLTSTELLWRCSLLLRKQVFQLLRH
jgi:glucosyltransferase